MTDEYLMEIRRAVDRVVAEELGPLLEARNEKLLAETRRDRKELTQRWDEIETRAERLAREERRAWDMYAAAFVGQGQVAPDAAGFADVLLGERRKRFGVGKEAQSAPGKVVVPAGVLLGAADLLENGGSEEHRKASAAVLRALVSE